MIDDHKMDLQLFRDEAQNGANPKLKALADETTHMIEDHLKMAQDLADKLGQ
jgi:predicted outer membrane protein